MDALKIVPSRMLAVIGALLVVVAAVSLSACSSQPASSQSKDSAEAAADKIYQLPDDDFAVAMNERRDYLILVNDDHKYEFGGSYDRLLQDDIIYAADCYGEPTPVEKAAYLAFSELQADLHAQGIEIALYSAYRSEADQQWVVDHYGNKPGWSDVNKVAQPGCSEHHTGLMIEYVAWYNGGDPNAEWEWTTVTAERASDPFYAPIWSSLTKHGFILRYPEKQESVTGTPYEPYELRFVGSSAIAAEIADAGTLEQYLEQESSSRG